MDFRVVPKGGAYNFLNEHPISDPPFMVKIRYYTSENGERTKHGVALYAKPDDLPAIRDHAHHLAALTGRDMQLIGQHFCTCESFFDPCTCGYRSIEEWEPIPAQT
jgi:hypothetical protein